LECEEDEHLSSQYHNNQIKLDSPGIIWMLTAAAKFRNFAREALTILKYTRIVIILRGW